MPVVEGGRPIFSKKDALCFLLFLALFFVVFNEFFFTDRVFYERDITVIEIPARKLCRDLLKEGNFALWTEAYGNGQPFLANPKNAVFYPSTLVYLFLPFFWAFKFHYLIHVILCWLGLYGLCTSYSLSRRAAFLGATLFVFSGMYLSSFEFYNHIAALAWLPWILLVQNNKFPLGFPRIVLVSLFWALMILAGAPEVFLISVLLAAAQAFSRPGEWKKRIATGLVTLILAGFISAVQLLPSAELLARTEKRSLSASWPLELIQLFNIPFPHFLGNDREPGHNDYWGWHLFDKKFPLYYSLYMGIGALLLFLFALKRPLERKRIIFLILFSAFFLLSCGRYSPFFFLYRYVPFLSSIRYPVKFFLGAVFCLSVLAAFGIDDLARGRKPGRRFVRNCLLVSAVGSVLYWPFKRQILTAMNKLLIIEEDTLFIEFGRSLETGITLLAVYALIFLAVEISGHKGRFLVAGLIAIAILDPAFHNRYINPTVPTSFFDRPALSDKFESPPLVYREAAIPPFFKQTVSDNARLLRFFRESLYPYTGIGEGVRYVFSGDFYGLYPSRYLDLMRRVHSLPAVSQLKLLDYLGCAAYVGHDPFFSTAGSRQLAIQDIDVWVEPITANRPRAYTVFHSIHAPTAEEKLRIFGEPLFDPHDAAIVEKDIVLSPPRETARLPRIFVSLETQGISRYQIRLDHEAVLMVPGNFSPGWHARVDGKKAALFEANLFSKGLIVPGGEHDVVLRYMPASFIWGATMSISTLLLILVLLVVSKVRAKRELSKANKKRAAL